MNLLPLRPREFAARRSDIHAMDAKQAIARPSVIAEDYGVSRKFFLFTVVLKD